MEPNLSRAYLFTQKSKIVFRVRQNMLKIAWKEWYLAVDSAQQLLAPRSLVKLASTSRPWLSRSLLPGAGPLSVLNESRAFYFILP